MVSEGVGKRRGLTPHVSRPREVGLELGFRLSRTLSLSTVPRMGLGGTRPVKLDRGHKIGRGT
jgi:hypothetical protein